MILHIFRQSVVRQKGESQNGWFWDSHFCLITDDIEKNLIPKFITKGVITFSQPLNHQLEKPYFQYVKNGGINKMCSHHCPTKKMQVIVKEYSQIFCRSIFLLRKSRWCNIFSSLLTHFSACSISRPPENFKNLWRHHKWFLTFPADIEMEHWSKIS